MATIIKGERRNRPGKWIVDYRDSFGRRRWKVRRTKEQAEDALAEVIRQSRQRGRPACDPDVTLAAYAERWLGQLAASVKPRTVESARNTLRLHLLPAFGKIKMRQLARGPIKEFLGEKLKAGYSQNTVRLLLAALRALLNAAVEDGLILANPAARLGRALRLVTSPSARQERVKAMTREQLAAFLEACRSHSHGHIRRLYPFFLVMARTGLRVGEALALQWADVGWTARSLRVERGFSGGRLETPKSGHGRDVDLSAQTVEVLRRLQVKRKAETLRRGWGELPPWIFPNEAGQPMDHSNLRKAFGKGLKAAGLPGHFTLHGLRHTFASLLLQQGESPVYVQRQLGHTSIKLTVDTYGKWLPMGNKVAVDKLDDAGAVGSAAAPAPAPTGSQPVAKTGSQAAAAGGNVVQLPDKIGEPWRSRTSNLLIKSQLLYQLS